jgi:hypothetical protein
MMTVIDMINPTISIPLDPQTAQAYNSASAEEKRKMQALLGLWLRELARSEERSLQQILDEAGSKAQAGDSRLRCWKLC